MPKIIENLSDKLLTEARHQLITSGYSAMTIRSVAAACQVGVGTVYHYFPSKDALTAAALLGDWIQVIESIQRQAENGFESVIHATYDGLNRFWAKYAPLFHDEAAESAFPKMAGKYHPMLLTQLADPIRPFCPDSFTAEFIAEALLTWSLKGTPFCKLYGMIRKLI